MPYVKRNRGIGAMPTGPTTINIQTGQTIAPGTTFSPASTAAVAPGGTGVGTSGYTINSDGSVTWYDALGNPITNVMDYNAAVSPGDSGAAALSVPSITSALSSLPPWAIPLGVGLFALVLFAGGHRR